MRAIGGVLDLLIPPRCPGCGREGLVLCEACAAPLWRRLHEPAGAPLGMPVASPPGLIQLEWCATYSGTARAALHALKYGGERRLAGPLAEAMAARWSEVGAGGELLTWVPVHPARLRERGFDQAELLARGVAGRLQLPVARCLERQVRTTAQHTLGRRDRASNVERAFRVPASAHGGVAGRWLVIVDDILTTGSTLGGCAAALAAGGASGVSALTVARDR